MEKNWFKSPENLEENKSNDNGMSYFQRGGSLEEIVQTNSTFLEPAGDLEESKSNNDGMSYFQRAGDLEASKQNNSFKFEKKEETIKTPEEIKNWIKSIVSGKKKATYGFCEGPQVTSSGKILVGVDELQQMVENGDNIISAEYLENINMVDIEFESFRVPNKSR